MCALLFFAILLAPFALGAVIYFCQREYIRRWCRKNGIDFKDHWEHVRWRDTISPY